MTKLNAKNFQALPLLAGPFAAKIPGDFAGDALGAGGTGAFGCTPRSGACDMAIYVSSFNKL